MARKHIDLLIADLATRQDNILGRKQLLGADVTEKAIRHRLRTRRLYCLYPGVYSLVAKPTLRGRYRAAVMACGKGAVLSHRSAGDYLGLRKTATPRIEITVPRGNGRRPKGILVHESRRPIEVEAYDGIHCTTPARTLVDLAAVLQKRELKRALERAETLRVFDLTAIRAALQRANGTKGTHVLRALLAGMADTLPPTRAEFEARLLELITQARIPQPIVNGKIEGHEVDFHWSAAKLIVETDGRETHDTAFAFERDHQRDLELELAGWHVIRITWRQLRDQPERIVAVLRAHLLP